MQKLNGFANALRETDFSLPGQTSKYSGKVRDVYTIQNKFLVMVVSDRISAFDVILPRPVPHKGQVLNQLAVKMISATEDILPNWIIDVPDPNVCIGRLCQPFKVEMVIRGYLTGHAWRVYKSGIRELCGVKLPEGMRENEKFPVPIITPTTKASEGHDEDISAEEIISRGIVSEQDYRALENFTRKVFKRGTEIAEKMGLILVDTKYEFGKADGEIMLIDEIHTPDSSRYFYSDFYEELFEKGLPQKQLSKEFVRQWLIENNFQGREGEVVPKMNDEWLAEISERYIELYERITGEKFVARNTEDLQAVIEKNIKVSLSRLGIS
ncbi:MAG: phosphoribosylaminoimidazolesuccinocarboxamide synthase [Bacteroidetes bacterium]|nr:MAG: phosphoribosylaminoimidazolesuccinocarboxamide synthase [Bacteroidota bacterium]REJ99967.1 MAG: phosphoribosylaminoimidazolesuccinocarboxamide synthase [Bacteroidota bacterium]REK35853.1 MAG: phosphoribosylaminoimidazolesuccinocarboxamide synthase [Bacteroidota bacterium]REK50670.1 MAG: phosphoribosylaminoimidazolesuccinocarboxamide synthase [Bacteroidota bacterium]